MMQKGFVRDSRYLRPDGKIYADVLGPSAGVPRRTHVMLHGGMHSGDCWVKTPDGRPGWAQLLAEHGDCVISMDWPGSGRSGFLPPNELTGTAIASRIARAMRELDGELLLWTHSMSGPFGWKIAELLGPRLATLVAIAPGPPGNIQPPAAVTERNDEKTLVELFGRSWTLPSHKDFRPEDKFVRVKFVNGSSHFPIEAYDSYFASLKSIPSKLLSERLNVDGSQLRIDDYSKLSETRFLVVCAENDPDHSFETDNAIVRDFVDNGLDAAMLYLPQYGIRGGGHMMMCERNSDSILALIDSRL